MGFRFEKEEKVTRPGCLSHGTCVSSPDATQGQRTGSRERGTSGYKSKKQTNQKKTRANAPWKLPEGENLLSPAFLSLSMMILWPENVGAVSCIVGCLATGASLYSPPPNAEMPQTLPRVRWGPHRWIERPWCSQAGKQQDAVIKCRAWPAQMPS